MKNLLVTEIERFAIHDGPGIRTLIFLKGCPLNCSWCCNPETQNLSPEMMHNRARCTDCGACIEACPQGAIYRDENDRIRNDRRKCTNCGECIPACIYYARKIVGEYYTTDELLKKCLKDMSAYKHSGGGVTVTGGEALTQSDALKEFLQKCKQHQLETGVETSGYVKWNVLDEVSEYLDLVMMDIKHLDPVKHEEYTGVPNDLILDNARKLSAKGVPMVISIPVIPGYNDDEKNLEQTAKFATELESLQRVRLLPYHRLGSSKYEGLDREYEFENVSKMEKDHVLKLKQIFEFKGLKVTVGF